MFVAESKTKDLSGSFPEDEFWEVTNSDNKVETERLVERVVKNGTSNMRLI